MLFESSQVITIIDILFNCSPYEIACLFSCLQICLGTVGKDSLSAFNGLYDMDNQAKVRQDCATLVG